MAPPDPNRAAATRPASLFGTRRPVPRRPRTPPRRRFAFEVQRLESKAMLNAPGGTPQALAFEGMARDEATSFYFETFLPPERVVARWQGDIRAGRPGTLDPSYRRAIVARVNAYRVMAGLPGVSLDARLSDSAQRAALMMTANGRLSHDPDPSWTHFSEDGAASAGRSNLSLGVAGPQAIDGYVDEGPPWNPELGHRRWLLYPPLEAVGVGDIPRSGVQGSGYLASNVLDVLGGIDPVAGVTRTDAVAWPPPGYVPASVVPQVWSFSLPSADFSSASVVVSRNGRPLPVEVNLRDGPSFGDPTIAWTLPGGLLPSPVETFEVTVSGVLAPAIGPDGLASGTAFRSYSYTTRVFDPYVTVPNGAAMSDGFSDPFAITAEEIAVDRRHGLVELELVRHGPLNSSTSTLTFMARDGRIAEFADSADPGRPRSEPFVLPVSFAEGERRTRVRLPLASTALEGPDASFPIDLYPGIVRFDPTGQPRTPTRPIGSVLVTLRSGDPPVIDPPPASGIPADFDGDGRSDYVVFTNAGPEGRFEIQYSGGGTRTIPLGAPGDLPVVGDYDGDGLPDVGVYRFDRSIGAGRFLILRSSDGTILDRLFGGPDDLPVVGDYDGDGRTDLAVHGFSANQGYSRFAILPSGGGPPIMQPFGGFDDFAIAADFDGDGIDDLAVYGYSGAEGFSRFAILSSAGNPARSIPFGGPDDRPILGDFDGDGIDDIAVYGYSGAEGFSRFGVLSSAGRPTRSVPFGGRDDLPISGDFDGDGLTDLAVFGYSGAEGFSRFGVLPSDGKPARMRPAREVRSIGLPSPPGLLRERAAAMARPEITAELAPSPGPDEAAALRRSLAGLVAPSNVASTPLPLGESRPFAAKPLARWNRPLDELGPPSGD